MSVSTGRSAEDYATRADFRRFPEGRAPLPPPPRTGFTARPFSDSPGLRPHRSAPPYRAHRMATSGADPGPFGASPEPAAGTYARPLKGGDRREPRESQFHRPVGSDLTRRTVVSVVCQFVHGPAGATRALSRCGPHSQGSGTGCLPPPQAPGRSRWRNTRLGIRVSREPGSFPSRSALFSSASRCRARLRRISPGRQRQGGPVMPPPWTGGRPAV